MYEYGQLLVRVARASEILADRWNTRCIIRELLGPGVPPLQNRINQGAPWNLAHALLVENGLRRLERDGRGRAATRVNADIGAFYRVWLGRTPLDQAVREGQVRVGGLPALARSFPRWFAWSPMVESVRAARKRGARTRSP